METQRIIHIAVLLIGTILLLPSEAQEPSKVSISVQQQPLPSGQIIYHYKVTNNDVQPISGFAIGSDYDNGLSELSVRPVNWTLERGIPSASATSPRGWKAETITTEGSTYTEVEWERNGNSLIPAGATQSGFSVVLPQPDPSYTNSHWTVWFSDASVTTGAILLEGTPRITITLQDFLSTIPGSWNLTLNVSNTGMADANDVRISSIVCRTLIGSGLSSIKSPSFPLLIGHLSAGSTIEVPVEINATSDIRKCALSEAGSLLTADRKRKSFSSSQVVYPKLP